MKHTHHILLFSLITAASLNSMEKKEWNIVRTFEQPNQVGVVSFSRNADILATASGSKLYLFNINKNKEVLSFDIKEGASAISIHNDLIATASGETARVRSIDNPENIIHCFQNKDGIRAIKFHDNGNLLAAAADHTARVFDLHTNKRIISIQHQDQPRSICFKGDNQIITASFNKVRVFDTRKIEKKIASVKRTNRFIKCVLTNADNGIITVETPFFTTWEPGNGTEPDYGSGNGTSDLEIPNQTVQLYDEGAKKTIDTGLNVVINPYAGAIDYYYNKNTLLFSIDLHPEKELLAFGISDDQLKGKVLVFAPKNQ